MRENGDKQRVFDLSESAYRESLKQSLVGIGGLEVRGRQCLTLTSVRYLMVARSKTSDRIQCQSEHPLIYSAGHGVVQGKDKIYRGGAGIVSCTAVYDNRPIVQCEGGLA